MARRALESAAAILPWSAGTAAVAVAVQVVLGARSPLVLPPERLAALALVAIAAPVLLAAAHGALAARLPDLAVALLVDRGLGLSERATAAVALAAAPDAESWAARAVAALRSRDPRRAIPLRPVGWRASVAALAALGLAFLLPSWPQAQGTEEQAPDARVVAAAEKLEEQAKKAEEELAERGADEEALDVLADVRKAAQRAQIEPMSKEETLQELERLDQRAKQEQAERRAEDAGALQRALTSLEAATAQREAAREASEPEAQRLQEQLESLAREAASGTSFEKRETDRMAARLRDAADALAESHPGLSEKLGELADALERGDMAAAAEIAKELSASAELGQLSSEAATQEGLEEASRMVAQAMASLGKAPTDQERRQMLEEAGGGGGEAGRPGDAPAAGMTRSGQAVVATDWGVGSTNEASPETRMAARGQQADRQSKETSDWREAYEALHESSALDGVRGRSTRVQGALGEGELVMVETRQVSRAPESARLPSVRVPESYARAQEEALAREEIPPAYRDAVRRYFTSLDGSASAPETPAAPADAPAPGATAPAAADGAPAPRNEEP